MFPPHEAAVRHFDVATPLPDALQPLQTLANNLWWCWSPVAIKLFESIDADLWQKSQHNPVRLLGLVPPARLQELATNDVFLGQLQDAQDALQRHQSRTPWFDSINDGRDPFTVAYFCAEFGMTESFQIYSGGLGCLAGDHLKSASELGIPLVAVGLLYRHGYFQQYLSHEGWQMEVLPDLDFNQLPVTRVIHNDKPVTVTVDLPGRTVHVALWHCRVGRIDLYLLDTDLPENSEADRGITGQLYGGDMETRIKQEIVLGIAGARALEAIGIRPDVCHLNEGHAAFVALERIRRLIEDHDLSFDEARQQAAASHCFTTHTPVPAGIDRFPADMIKAYFKDFHPSLKLDMEGLLALGRDDVFNKKEPFSMATLAIRTADWCNGVSQLHGEVSRGMWQGIWPGVPEQEIPIGAVTNGVHASTWLIPEIADALDAHTAPGHRRQHPEDFDAFKAIHHVPDEELWDIHEKYRQRLVDFACKTNPFRPQRLGPSYRAPKGLDPHALTIGFARRFATYKRGNLLLRDPQRLLNLLNHPNHPIQFVIAGKAHPADHQGKELIQQLVRFADDHGVGHRLVFLENYDMQVARYLVQGSDVWLNNPRRGMEASGTSGMKAAMNGIPNCSILDGWWDEAYTPHVGWAIGHREDYDDPNTADHYESRALYDLLENHIAPEFYARDTTGIPRQWVHRMKQSIAELGPFFNTNRMVAEYTQDYYLPAVDRAHRLAADRFKPAVTLAGEKARLRYAWPSVHIADVALDSHTVPADQPLPLTVTVETGGLPADALLAQACYGTVSPTGQITDFHAKDLEVDTTTSSDGTATFKGELHPHTPGRQGLCVRVVPAADLPTPIHEPGLIRWFGQAKPTPPAKQEPTPEAAATTA